MNPKSHGIGLYICGKISNALNGQITVTSSEGYGAKFEIVFKAKKARQNLQPELLLTSLPRLGGRLAPNQKLKQLKKLNMKIYKQTIVEQEDQEEFE